MSTNEGFEKKENRERTIKLEDLKEELQQDKLSEVKGGAVSTTKSSKTLNKTRGPGARN